MKQFLLSKCSSTTTFQDFVQQKLLVRARELCHGLKRLDFVPCFCSSCGKCCASQYAIDMYANVTYGLSSENQIKNCAKKKKIAIFLCIQGILWQVSHCRFCEIHNREVPTFLWSKYSNLPACNMPLLISSISLVRNY